MNRSFPAWTRSCAACCRWPCFGRGVGLDLPQRSFPTLNILWFCESLQSVMSYINGAYRVTVVWLFSLTRLDAYSLFSVTDWLLTKKIWHLNKMPCQNTCFAFSSSATANISHSVLVCENLDKMPLVLQGTYNNSCNFYFKISYLWFTLIFYVLTNEKCKNQGISRWI